MAQNDDSTTKKASNSAMTADLAERLAAHLSQMSEASILEGLEPVQARLARLFQQSEAAAETTGIGVKLLGFCRSYIQFVPEQSQRLQASGRELNLTALISTYTGLATNYLNSACDELEQSKDRLEFEQFLILLHGAYIFGRMVEELDDKIESFVGVPLSDVNLMEANLIAHEILGDNFANRLDRIVESLVQQSKISKQVIEADLDQNAVAEARLSKQSLMGVEIRNFATDDGFSMMSGLL